MRGPVFAAALGLCVALPGVLVARTLHVSLYPYIPDAAAAALTLKQDFENGHPDVVVEITFNRNYYSTVPADKGVLFEDADVHEIDQIFLNDFVVAHRLQPLPVDFDDNAMVPASIAAAKVDGALMAMPHWLCSDFLFYRADEDLGSAHSLADVEHVLSGGKPGGGLLMDMDGQGALGEVYLASLLARDGSGEAAARALAGPADAAVVERLRRTLSLEPAGFGRDADYDARGSFYARQFGRRAAGAFVGYSEMLHDILEEGLVSCRHSEKCLTAEDVRVTAWPFADNAVRPPIWVDMFGIDARVKGAAVADAQDFIRFATSRAGFRRLLIPEEGKPPRYLLPARADIYRDAAVLREAPLYRNFLAIINKGEVVAAPHLGLSMHEAGLRVDRELPPVH